MKNIGKTIIAVIMAVTMLAATACSDKTPNDGNDLPNAQTTVTVRSALNTVKVLQDDDINAFGDAILSFEAAKGETEGAQLVLRAEADTSYDVTVSSLRWRYPRFSGYCICVKIYEHFKRFYWICGRSISGCDGSVGLHKKS